MKQQRKRNTGLFVGLLLLAGIMNLLSRNHAVLVDVSLSCGNHLIMIGLVLFWIQSVRTRLLLSKSRTYILCCGGLMLVYLLIRVFKYIIADTALVIRYSAYAYWIPQMLMPVMITDRHFRPRYGSETELQAEIRKREGAPGLTVTLETNGNPPATPIRESSGLRPSAPWRNSTGEACRSSAVRRSG